MMTAHVNYPCLDSELPASLSYKIQTLLLRNNLGFKGLIISDDMDMKALAAFGATKKTTLAIKAGTDLLLFGNGMDGMALQTCNEIIEAIILEPRDQELDKALQLSDERLTKFFCSN